MDTSDCEASYIGSYDAGFKARHEGAPWDVQQTRAWQSGWQEAHQSLDIEPRRRRHFELPLILIDISGSHVNILGTIELLGMFEQVVLFAVRGLGEDAYGRAVLRTVQSASGGDRSISAGAVYATLDRVGAKGLLFSRIEEGTPARGGRARRLYRLTSAGASALGETWRTLETATF